MCAIRGCPWPGSELCGQHRQRESDPAPFARPGAVVDLGEPDWRHPATGKASVTPPRAETSLEEWARRLAERKAGRLKS